MPWGWIVGGLLAFAVLGLVIHYAKRSEREKARADSSGKTSKVLGAFAEIVGRAKDIPQLKERAARRRRRRTARRKSGD